MSQATLSERPYVNANLFSGHYLDERVQERDEWDCDDDARRAIDDLQTLYELEGSLVEGSTLITLLSHKRFRVTGVQEQRVVIEFLDSDKVDDALDVTGLSERDVYDIEELTKFKSGASFHTRAGGEP